MLPLLVGVVFVAYPFWMQWSWLPRTRRRAVEDGRLEQWEPTARLIATTSWVLLGCGLVAILIGVLELG